MKIILSLPFLYGVASATNSVIPKPECDTSKKVSVRYSGTSERLYVEKTDGIRGGCITLTEIYNIIGPNGPLYPISGEDGVWNLDETLYIEDGVTLNVHGTSVGGDCNHLRMLSNSKKFINLRAHGGSLDFMNTTVTSWDDSTSSVDTNFEDGRSYISCLSEVLVDPSETCTGVAKNNMGECRMDVENSKLSYLGYDGSESWGLSWKIRGLCNDLSNEDAYKNLGVYGNIYNSEIHNMYYGIYTYGHKNGDWVGNKVYDNKVYGFDPHHRSSDLNIIRNEVYGNGNHGIIASKECDNVIVSDNYVHNNVGVGIFLHWLGDNALVSNNTIVDNIDTGVAFLESSHGLIVGNTISRNNIGLRLSVGSMDNVIVDNSFDSNTGYDLYTYEGSDPVVELESGFTRYNVFYMNRFSGDMNEFRFDDSVSSQFTENVVTGPSSIELRDSTKFLFSGNIFEDGVQYDISGESCLEPKSDVDFGIMCETSTIDVFTRSYVESTIPSSAPTDRTASPTLVDTTVSTTMGPSVVDIPFETESPVDTGNTSNEVSSGSRIVKSTIFSGIFIMSVISCLMV